MFRPCLTALACLALAACATGPRSTQTQSLRIATWNLEHLAALDGAGCRPRTEADYATLRAYAVQLNADVVALQEVENEAAAHRVFSPADYDIVMSGQPYPSGRDVCGDDPAGPFVGPQRTAFAIRKTVPYAVNPPLEALKVPAGRDRPVRWGVDVTLTGEQPVRLLGVHLKSGCSAGAKPDSEDCPILFSQVPVVEAWMDARESEGMAFVVLGDFNRRLGETDEQVYRQWDDGDPAGLNLHLAAAEAAAGPRAPLCDGGRWPEFIDHIVLSDRAAALWTARSFDELAYAERGDAMPSDHCPVAITIDR